MAAHPIQTEIDAHFLYEQLANQEKDAVVAEIFRQMAAIEGSHAEAFAKKDNIAHDRIPGPSWRARIINLIGRTFGYQYVLGVLMDTEKSISNAIIRTKQRKQMELTGHETNHVQILRSILDRGQQLSGSQLTRFEKRHRTVGGNAIRAAVLGGNDGLVSNFSLVMGVAGATNGGSGVLLAGVAGLLAGALSMALGEWISVKSSQELYENQMKLEMEELESNPEGEQREIMLMYKAKGISDQQAAEMAAKIIGDKTLAHEFLVREELGINPEELKGSALQAALYSFFLFSLGACIPVLPFFFTGGYKAIWISMVLSAIGLFVIGGAITLFTGRNFWFSGFRQMIFGLIAAAITFGIGKWIGVQVS